MLPSLTTVLNAFVVFGWAETRCCTPCPWKGCIFRPLEMPPSIWSKTLRSSRFASFACCGSSAGFEGGGRPHSVTMPRMSAGASAWPAIRMLAYSFSFTSSTASRFA